MSKYSEEIQKTAEGLRIIDDALFHLVAEDREACQEMLRTLLDDEELNVIKVTAQMTIPSLHRSIILDALCEIKNALVNIEVQKRQRER